MNAADAYTQQQLKINPSAALQGRVRASGAKNAVLPIIAATILASKPVTLHNVPKLQDVLTIVELLESLGAAVEYTENTLVIDPCKINKSYADYRIVSKMRASFVVLGPLLAKFGDAIVSLPGGCQIGARGVDQHLKGLKALQADIQLENGYVHAKALSNKRLQGNTFVFDMVTVTGTENILMAAVLAEGITRLENCAKEPEVVDLANMLNTLGAKISGIGSDVMIIEGVKELGGGSYKVMPDRIEVGTYLVAAAMTYGNVEVYDCVPEHQYAVIEKLREAGCGVDVKETSIRVYPKAERLKAVNIKTAPYPLFPTDMQAQFMALNTVAEGTATIVENIFENRFMHVAELCRMGANITVEGNMAVIKGVDQLSGTMVAATDLRASACLILAGLTAKGATFMSKIHHLDRGYDDIEAKFSSLGAELERITIEK